MMPKGAQSKDNAPKMNLRYRASATLEILPSKLIKVHEPTEKEKQAFQGALSGDTQQQLISKTVRFFLMKGATRQTILKTQVSAMLRDMNPDAGYHKHLHCVVLGAQKELRETFGYGLTHTIERAGGNTSAISTKEYYMFSLLKSPTLQQHLMENDVRNQAWLGFVFIVLHCINSSTGKIIEAKDLLFKLREVDPRFPETISSTSSSKADSLAIPELGGDFKSLMKKMVAERYAVVQKEAGEKTFYEVGPRYYAEFGRQQIITSYYTTLGDVPIDERLLNQAKEEERNAQSTEEEEEELAEAILKQDTEIQLQEAQAAKERESAPREKRKRKK